MKSVKTILIIIGVALERTPVIVEFISDRICKGYDVQVIEYKSSKVSFVLRSLLNNLFNKEVCAIYCVGLQTLPILFFTQKFNSRAHLKYWALESYSLKDNKSLAVKMMHFYPLIDWKVVTIILPEVERYEYHNKYEYKMVHIINNVPRLGRPFIERKIHTNGTIRLVIYGDLTEERTYLLEMLEFCNEHVDWLQIDIFGYNPRLAGLVRDKQNINYHGQISHNNLIEVLKNEYHYSMVGYKPINFNTHFCAPNKYYESLSLSLPIIVHTGNPTLVRLSKESGACVIADFQNFRKNLNKEALIKDYSKRNISAHLAYNNHLHLENYVNEICD